jgi:hypothetical protein
MPNTPSLNVSKLEAATRQIETAIALYFQDGDPVSIHTLACAAYEILETLNQRSGGQPTIRQQFGNDIKPEYVKFFYSRLASARNFFKHAKSDPDASIEFSQLESEVVMLDACLTHKRLAMTELPSPDLGTFTMWSALTWASKYMSYPGLDIHAPAAARLAGLSRAGFFSEMLPIARHASAEDL